MNYMEEVLTPSTEVKMQVKPVEFNSNELQSKQQKNNLLRKTIQYGLKEYSIWGFTFLILLLF